jgi:hypothetical protein
MPANIMMDWSGLAPKRDFFESFVAPLLAGQEMAQNQAQTQQAQIQNQYLPQKYETEILGQELLNQERQSTLPYAASSAEARLIGQLLMNEGKGIENQFMPQEQQMKMQEHNLMNAVKNMQMQKYAAEIARLNDPANPLNNATGVAGQLAAYNTLKSQGDPNADLILENIKRQMGGSSRAFSKLPMDVKRAQIAQAAAFGLDYAEAGNRLNNGETLEQIAAGEGIPAEEMYNYEPIYPAGQTAISQVQKRQGAEAELDSLTEQYRGMIDKYSDVRTVGGYSPTQVMDAIQGKNVDDQADFIVATMLYPEITYNRLRLAGAETGISSLEHLESVAADKFKAFVPLFNNAELKDKVISKMNSTLGKASEVANAAILNPIGAAQKRKEKKIKEEATHTIKDENNLSEEDIDAQIAALKAELGE